MRRYINYDMICEFTNGYYPRRVQINWYDNDKQVRIGTYGDIANDVVGKCKPYFKIFGINVYKLPEYEKITQLDQDIERLVAYNSADYWVEFLLETEVNWFKCYKCGKYENADDGIWFVNGYRWCQDCVDEAKANGILRSCPDCGGVYTSNQWDEEFNCCTNCAENKYPVRSYHAHPKMKWYGEPNKNWSRKRNGQVAMRGIGCELEIDQGDGNEDWGESTALRRELFKMFPDNEIFYERDGSLCNGFEIITQPHTYKAFKKMPWEKIMTLCRQHGFKSHDAVNEDGHYTCGLHFHISREIFGRNLAEQNRNIAKLIYFYDHFWDDVVKFSRRTQRGLEWCGRYSIRTLNQAKHYAVEYHRNGEHDDRYYAVNVTNAATVEIRIMRGTLKYETFMASLDFIWRTAMNSKRIGEDDLNNLGLWLKGIKAETVDYMRERECFKEFTDPVTTEPVADEVEMPTELVADEIEIPTGTGTWRTVSTASPVSWFIPDSQFRF